MYFPLSKTVEKLFQLESAMNRMLQEKLIDALSLTRERVRVWVSENLSLQKLNSAQKKDRHPHPPSPIDKWERAQKMYSR